MHAPLNVAVIGAGAVGLGLGSCLLADRARVHFSTRSATDARLLRDQGLSRSGIFGDVRFAGSQLSAAHELGALARDRHAAFDFVLICTKSHASQELARALAHHWERLGDETILVLCQNGWGSAAHFRESLGAERVYSARVITGFRRAAPNAVEITVHAEAVRIGSLFGADEARVAPLAQAIARGGLPCETTATIGRDLWAKMLYNCALNPLGALLGVRYGALGAAPETRSLMDGVIDEIFRVLAVSRQTTHWPDAATYRRHFYRTLLPPTAAHESSMLQDLRAGRRSEIDALCGAVARLARAHGVDAPVNDALWRLVSAIDLRAASESAGSVD